ncbi:MAG: chlororespiratory reduction 6 domain-containing protein [Gemmatimonadota bacterium]|uniref:chlororespiratory reduction 6 domain-containing protein n=1 Tax=Candidatus Palauibacter soopunensis TaxID=3056739 RepID=UPI0023A181BE|nr:chlororespiratory reduction 6 domain-containing protein [Candidatus Palauibacter soopunensis]MDE2781600.1 chlororespiratory reduction 6 domain-containing protein [Gemmatimonadota bacterium]MDE2879695.1 chlororespiratory reduction 6 domain-containing protein [Candidatus Palauibacter soopunensis]
MKLTVTNPEVLDWLVDMPAGLMPFRRVGDSRLILVVKASREVAQTARVRGGFRFYLVPVHVDGLATYGLVTAFFDDHEEPLVIRTPLVNAEIPRNLVGLLSSASFYVHFFDEHNRELLGVRVENPDANRFRVLSDAIRFVSPTLDQARHVLDAMQSRFGTRTRSDDAAAFPIRLRERLFPDSLEENVENPGDLNEPDIAMALHRPFRGDQVFSNPMRADNGREFVDVLVATTKTLLLIQAKDSPSTESGLTRTINRKKATAEDHVENASAQLKGSINHLRSGQSIEIVTEGKRRRVSMSGRDVFGLVIVKELFDPERPVCSPPVLAVFDETGIPCLLLDHTEFQQLTFFQTTEDSFVGALEEMFSAARAEGAFPRSRFGLRTGKTVVYDPTGIGNVPDSTTHERVHAVTDGSHIIAAPTSGRWVTDEAAGKGFREDVGADWLRVVVDRSDVEALDVSGTAETLSRVLADRDAVERYRGSVDLAFFGYTNDPRELRDIPDVRRFCTELDDAFPYWFYFLSTDGGTLGVIASCLCSVTPVRPGVVSFGPDLPDFVSRHYQALNWLFHNYSLDERLNVEISGKVFEYFGQFEPVQ